MDNRAKERGGDEDEKLAQNLARFEQLMLSASSHASAGRNAPKSNSAITKKKRQSIGAMELEALDEGRAALFARSSPSAAQSKAALSEEAAAETLALQFSQSGVLDADQFMRDGFAFASAREAATFLLDQRHDAALALLTSQARACCAAILDVRVKTTILALYVANAMGGSRCAASTPSSDDFLPPSLRLSSLSKQEQTSLSNFQLLNDKSHNDERKAGMIHIGRLSHGMAVPRALLFKFLADRCQLPSELHYCRSKQEQFLEAVNDDIEKEEEEKQEEEYLWNVVQMGDEGSGEGEGEKMVVDLMHAPSKFYPIDTDEARRYIFMGCKSDSQQSYSPPSSSSPSPALQEGATSISSEKVPLSLVSPSFSGEGADDGRWMLPRPFASCPVVLCERFGSGGGGGSVWRANIAGFICAVKVTDLRPLTKAAKQRVTEEIMLLRKLHHPNIVTYLGEEKRGHELRIFLEAIPRCLFQTIQDIKKGKRAFFRLKEIITCIMSISQALIYLHSREQPIVHGDIKSKNILIELRETEAETTRSSSPKERRNIIRSAKLCDFGSSRVLVANKGAMTNARTTNALTAPRIGTTRYSHLVFLSFCRFLLLLSVVQFSSFPLKMK
ncbi:copper transport protein ctr1, variant 3 [Balamuthia mandrillaris]